MALLLVGCLQSDLSGAPTDSERASFQVQVISTNGEPIRGATISRGDTLLAETDERGRAELTHEADGALLARVEADGFAPASIRRIVTEPETYDEEVRLFPLGEHTAFDAGLGGEVEKDFVRVRFAPNSIVDSRGELVTGDVTLTIVPLDPTTTTYEDMPDPLEGVGALGEPVHLRSFAMADFSLWRGTERLQIAPGASAEIEYTLPASLTAGLEGQMVIPLWSLDLDSGLWREESIGHAVRGPSGDWTWTAETTHFSWLNCDLAVSRRDVQNYQCFTFMAVDEDGAIVEGVDFTLSSSEEGVFVDGGRTIDTLDNHNINCANALSGTEPVLQMGDSAPVPLRELTTLSGRPSMCNLGGSDNDDDQMPTSLSSDCPPVVVRVAP